MAIKLSIITVNLNNKAGLEKTIESVRSQTTRDFEFIVIDGASTDGSVELISKYSEIVTVFISEKDSGIYEAMNKGIAKARGEYLQFLNSGDILYQPGTLSEVLPKLGTVDIVYGNMKINDRGQITDGYMPHTITLEHMVRDTLWHPVSFIKKKLFHEIGLYDTSFRIVGDYDFFFRAIIVNRCSLLHINKFIVVFDLSGLSSDIKNVTLIQSEKERVQKNFLTQEQFDSFKIVTPRKKNILERIKEWFQSS